MIALTGLSKDGKGGGEKGEGNFLRTDRQANGRTIQRILGKSGSRHFLRQIGPGILGPDKLGSGKSGPGKLGP